MRRRFRVRGRRLVAIVEVAGRHRCVVVRNDGVWPLRAAAEEPRVRCRIEERKR